MYLVWWPNHCVNKWRWFVSNKSSVFPIWQTYSEKLHRVLMSDLLVFNSSVNKCIVYHSSIINYKKSMLFYRKLSIFKLLYWVEFIQCSKINCFIKTDQIQQLKVTFFLHSWNQIDLYTWSTWHCSKNLKR